MKVTTFIFGLLILPQLLFSNLAPKEKSVKSEIKRVTVFRTGAQVSREASATIPAGNSLVKFTGISPNINKQSIQIKGNGDFTILSVNHQINFFEEPEKTTRIESLELENIRIQDLLNEQNALLKVLQEEESLILTNKSIGGQQTGVKIEELRAIAEFYRTRLKEIKLESLSINKNVKVQKDSIARIKAQLSSLNANQGIYTSEIVLAVNSKRVVQGDFVLSYVVKNAGWFPNYDIRVKDVQNPIELIYKGNVFQTSGESWDNVKLTLSTGDFSQTGTKPTLEPWRLGFYVPVYAYKNGMDRYQGGVYSGTGGRGRLLSGRVTDTSGEPLIGATVMVSGTSIGTVADIDGRYSLELPNNAQNIIISYTGFEQIETAINSTTMNIVLDDSNMMLEEVVVTGMGRDALAGRVAGLKGKMKKRRKAKNQIATQATVVKKDRTTTVQFEIELPYTIPTNGKQYTVQMQSHELPAYFEYYCAPKLDKDAFLTAQVTEWEDLNLLSGEANLFFEGTYLGKSLLDTETVEDTLNLSLGRDRDIVITRKKQKEFTKKQFIGNKRTDTRAWDIEIRNKKKQAINIVIEDQYPISTDEKIEIKMESDKQAIHDKDKGLLRWKFKLESGGTNKLGFRYSVKYPKKKRVDLE